MTDSLHHRVPGTGQAVRARPLVSVVIPVLNEEKSLPHLFASLRETFGKVPYDWQAIFVDDGSTDGSAKLLHALSATHANIVVIEFSRNFGKEIAMTAGIRSAEGDAVICIDADLQHPPHMIPEFLAKWREGAEVVIGVRNVSGSDDLIKRLGSWAFYTIMAWISDRDIVPHATDFRLLDRVVVEELNRFTERNRMTRALIDWLGFRREFIHFDADERADGVASYSFFKLFNLAMSSFIAHSLFPLRVAGYLGIAIVLCSSLLGGVMMLDRYVMDRELNFSGTAILADVILFLIGIVLVCLGLLAFYIAHIHQETQNRPLYAVRSKKR